MENSGVDQVASTSKRASLSEWLSDSQLSAEDQFRIQEFIELRSEIAAGTEETRKLERFCLVGVAAIFSWVTTNASSTEVAPHYYISIVVPSMLVFFGWTKSFAIESTIQEIGRYLAGLETRMLSDGEGWETYYARESRGRKMIPERISEAFWPLLFAASIVTSLVLFFLSPAGRKFIEVLL